MNRMNRMSKQVDCWARDSRADLRVADMLMKARQTRHALYLHHLAMEKLLKALVCKATRIPAPRSRSLPTLAGQTGVDLQAEQESFLSRLDRFSLAKSGPENDTPIPCGPEALTLTQEFRKIYRFLAKQL
jgi:HEPN domain-containing protein